jgi:hypothetical protein
MNYLQCCGQHRLDADPDFHVDADPDPESQHCHFTVFFLSFSSVSIVSDAFRILVSILKSSGKKSTF